MSELFYHLLKFKYESNFEYKIQDRKTKQYAFTFIGITRGTDKD